MKKTIIGLLCIATLGGLTSCKDKAERAACAFLEAVNKKDTTAIDAALLPRHAAWGNAVYAEIDKSDVHTESTSDGRYKTSVNDTTFFVFSLSEDGSCKIEKVRNIFILPEALKQEAKQTGDLAADYDDIDIMAVAHTITDEAAAQKAQLEFDESVDKKLRKFYSNYVFGSNAFDADAADYCTPRMLKKLAAAYEYEDGGYAVWELRSGMQDGDGQSTVNEVNPLGDGWYEVDFLDMGEHCKKKIKVVKQGSKIMFDDYK